MDDLRPAGQHTVRRHNTGLVLGAIAGADAPSRAAVAERTGLTKATVSTLVEGMIAARLVTETGPQSRAGRGRRGTGLILDPNGVHGLGVEIGVDFLACSLVDLTGRERRRRVRGGDNRDSAPRRVLDRLATLVRTALADAAALGVEVGGLGVAVPGLVEPAAGLLRYAPNLGWQDVDLVTRLRARAGLGALPVRVGNEAEFAALAELTCGAGAGLADFVYVSGQVGIGGGIIAGGRPLPGSGGFGGEIGHLPVDPDGPRCACGAHGCLERLAGMDTVLRAAGLPVTEPDALRRRLADGDPAAAAAVTDAGRWLGIGLAAVLNTLDVPTVVLGGRYGPLLPWLAGPVTEQLRSRVVTARWRPVELLAATLGPHAPARGAALTTVQDIVRDPSRYLDDGARRPA